MSKSKSPRFLFVPLLALGILGQSTLLFREPFGKALIYRGYSYYQLGFAWHHFWHRFPRWFETIPKLSKKLKGPDRRFFCWGLLYGLRFEKEEIHAERLSELIQKVPVGYRSYFLEAFGIFVGDVNKDWRQIPELMKFIPEEEQGYFYQGLTTNVIFDGWERLPQYLQAVQTIPPHSRPWFYFNLGILLYDRGNAKRPADIQNFVNRLPLREDEKRWLFRGMGEEVGSVWCYDRASLDDALRRIPVVVPSEYQNDILWGVGWGVRREIVEDRVRAMDWMGRLPRDAQKSALEGFEACERWYGISTS